MNIVILCVEQKPIIKINVEYIHSPFQIRILGGVVEMVIVELASSNNQFSISRVSSQNKKYCDHNGPFSTNLQNASGYTSSSFNVWSIGACPFFNNNQLGIYLTNGSSRKKYYGGYSVTYSIDGINLIWLISGACL